MKTTKMGKDSCPTCNYVFDSASSIQSEHIPMPGDLSVCYGCGEFLHFENDMAVSVLPIIKYKNLPEERNSNYGKEEIICE